MQGIQISIHQVGARQDISLVIVSGYVDTTTCHELSSVFKKLIDQKQYLIIVDLGGASYISSAGWGVFMGEIKKIRELSGDIKIVQMPPEVFEVFEMLEFNRIINYYDAIEEAIDEFDIIRGIDITNPEERIQTPKPVVRIHEQDEPISQELLLKRVLPKGKVEDRMSVKDLPLVEKIKRIVLDDPLISTRGITKTLNTEKYGKVKINWFKIRILLKQQSLDTKEKRFRFYRSR